GIPKDVVGQAKEKLVQLEQQDSQKGGQIQPAYTPVQNDLFAVAEPDPALEKLEGISPDDLTPRQALELLYELKALAKG
ncbi:hypothetical protein ABMA58_02425, partial [Oceanospirillum sp. HFRX-1_2]